MELTIVEVPLLNRLHRINSVYRPARQASLRWPESEAIRNVAKGTEGRRPGALVLGGDVGALGVVRSLGRRNIPVWTVTNDIEPATLSRYSQRNLRWPTTVENEKVAFLLELAHRYQLDGWVLFPIGDELAATLARNRSVLATAFRVTTPEWDILRLCYDKRLTYKIASDLGISHPRTFCPRDRSQVAALHCDFPVILKPAYKPTKCKLTRDKAWAARDRDELLKYYDRAVSVLDPDLIIVQEWIPGGNEGQFSFAGLFQDGLALAAVGAKRVRQYPLDFGKCSSFVETIQERSIEIPSEKLLQAMRYSGIAEVEFKRDPRDGEYKLLEVNPRIWYWHSLGAKAGVDFPYLVWRWVQNEAIDKQYGAPGVRWVQLTRDLAAAAGEISRGRISPKEYLRSLGHVSDFAALTKDDPLPGLLALLFWPLRFVRQRLHRIARAA